MDNTNKKITKKRNQGAFDGLFRYNETSTLRQYRERLFNLESRLMKLEARLDEIERVLMLGRS